MCKVFLEANRDVYMAQAPRPLGVHARWALRKKKNAKMRVALITAHIATGLPRGRGKGVGLKARTTKNCNAPFDNDWGQNAGPQRTEPGGHRLRAHPRGNAVRLAATREVRESW